jgi:WD40 repeat protein
LKKLRADIEEHFPKDHPTYLSLDKKSALINKSLDGKPQRDTFVHEFKGHSKAITGMKHMASNESYLVTSSMDGSIKIWCLEKMIELYSFQVNKQDGAFDDQMENIVLLDDRIYALFNKGFSCNVEVGSISHLVSSFYISKPKVMSVVKGFSDNLSKH